MKKYTSDEAINAQILKALASSIRVVVIAGSNKTTVFSPRSNCLLNVKLPNDRAILARELGVEESELKQVFRRSGSAYNLLSNNISGIVQGALLANTIYNNEQYVSQLHKGVDILIEHVEFRLQATNGKYKLKSMYKRFNSYLSFMRAIQSIFFGLAQKFIRYFKDKLKYVLELINEKTALINAQPILT